MGRGRPRRRARQPAVGQEHHKHNRAFRPGPRSSSTDLLITGADVGAGRLTKAEELGIQIVDQGVICRQLIAAGIT
jgi:NAD-dependent DNA ligase